MIQFTCTKCNKVLKVKDELQGKQGKCPGCQALVIVPMKRQASSEIIESKPAAVKGELLSDPEPSEIPFAGSAMVSHDRLADTVHIQTEPQKPTAVQVNVNTKGHSNSLAIGSVVLGIVGLLVSWIPIGGLSLALLGALLGFISVFASLNRRGSGIGIGIAGFAISIVAALPAVFSTSAFVSAMQDSSSRQARVVYEQQSQPTTNQPQAGSGVAVIPPGPVFHDASKPLRLGSIEVKVVSATVGKVPLNSFTGRDQESVDDLLVVRLEIKNLTEKKKLSFRGWHGMSSAFHDVGISLRDDSDNYYLLSTFGSSTIADSVDRESIYPGDTIKTAAAFEKPIKGVEHLDLAISSEMVAEKGEFRFRIPAEMIQVQ